MFRSLLQRSSILKGFVEQQYRNFKHEEIGYIAAFLARYRQQIQLENSNNLSQIKTDELIKQTYEQMNIIETNEHWQLSKADHLEQLFEILNVIHKLARNKELLINKRVEQLSNLTDIIDPNMFPIFSLIDKMEQDEHISLWEFKPDLMEIIEKELGYKIYEKLSNIEHHEAGNGIFLSCKDQGFVRQGTLIGLVPGVIYNSYENFVPDDKMCQQMPTYLKRYDNTVIDFSQKIPYPFSFGYALSDYQRIIELRIMSANEENNLDKLVEIQPEFMNPFALGHKINHPPPGQSANVILLDLIIPNHFFTADLMRYLPYIKYSHDKDTSKLKEFFHNDCIHGLGVFSIAEIADGEELYMDYLDCKLYNMESPTPDWLQRPAPYDPHLTKREYEFQFSFLANLIDSYLINKDLQKYVDFEKKVSHDPTQFDKVGFIQQKIDKKKK